MENSSIFNKFSKRNNPVIKYPIKNYKTINSKLSKITSIILGKKFDYQDLNSLRELSNEELLMIQSNFAGKYQKNLYQIFKPLIYEKLKSNYTKSDYQNFRVGVQIKYKWNKKNQSFNRKLVFDDQGVWHESLKEENFCFPTRPHQDLANNGYRGSGIMIFYYQASHYHKDQSNMVFSKPKSDVKILKYTNKYKYGNQIDDGIYKRLNWYYDKNLNYKNLIVMDPYTIHSSDKKAKIPRIAFNVKLQPSNYFFLFEKDLKSFKSNIKDSRNEIQKLKILYDYLKKKSLKNNRLNFELAVLSKLLNDELKMKRHFEKILSFKPTNKTINEFLCGAFLKITQNDITTQKLNLVKTNKPKIVKFSCAYNLLNTIGLSRKYLEQFNA